MPVTTTSLASLLHNLKVDEPYLPPKNWESLLPKTTKLPPPITPPSSSSSSVSESSLVKLSLNALQGVESSLISIQKISSTLSSKPSDRTFHKIPTLWHRLTSTDALGQILKNIGCFGSLVFLLNKFVDHFTNIESLVNQAFAIAVRKVLQGYISSLDTLCVSIELRRGGGGGSGSSRLGVLTNVVHPNITLLEVFLHSRELRTQIEALGNICGLYDVSLSYCSSTWTCLNSEAGVRFNGFYSGSELLSYLYSQLKVSDPAHSAMLKFLFLKTCEPYCEFIRSWIFKAELNDPHNEFIVESSSLFSWNKPGISSLEQEGRIFPCFLDGFLVPIVRAGQQLQVITKLLELCNIPASGHKAYTDLLPCWMCYSSPTSQGYGSPITFSKLHIEEMIKKREDYYGRMLEKLGEFSKTSELFPGQVHGAISVPISYGDGRDIEKSSVYFTLDENLLNAPTVGMDLLRGQSGSDFDEQKTEDSWFSEIDALSCSSECSSNVDSLEAYDSQSTLVGPPLQSYLSALRFSVASDEDFNRNLVQHSKDKTYVLEGEKADTEKEESTEGNRFVGPHSIESWPFGGLPRNPFCVDKMDAEDDREYQHIELGATTEQNHIIYTGKRLLFVNNIPTEERKHDLKEIKVNYPHEVLSMNPGIKCDFLHKHGNTNRREQGKTLPWFDFSAVDNPSKTCLGRIPVGDPIDSHVEAHSSHTNIKSCRHANQDRCIVVVDPKVSSSPDLKDCNEEKKSNACGGSRWEGMLHRSNNPETSPDSDCRQSSSSSTFELPLDFVIDKCLLQEIHLQYNFVSKLAIKLLEEGFGLQEHLLALRRYHFMELADWADVFVVSLWHHKGLVTEVDKRIAEIQGFLESSIQRSSCERDTFKDRLFLYKRQQGLVHHPLPSAIGVGSFDFLGLGYRVDWPISLIITSDALKAYADVFSFMVQVKLAAYVLTDVWSSLKDVRHKMHENKEKIGKQELWSLNILMKLRQQVNHFVSTLQQYVHSELSHVSWSKFLHSLKHKVKDMMDLESVHMAYLSEALRICFLSEETRVISNIINNILQCALDLQSCVPKGIQTSGRVPNDSWTETLGINTSQVMMVKQNFDKELKELHLGHQRSPKHGATFGLSRLWDCLNFSLYYSDILHDSNIFALFP